MLQRDRKYLSSQGVNSVLNLKENTYNKDKAAVQDDAEEIRVCVKIRPSVTENVAHADVPADANVQHVLATADALNLAAPRDADLEVAYAGVK